MKLLLLLFLTFSVSAQQLKSRDLLVNKAPCEFSMTKEDLMSEKLQFHCEALSNNQLFNIKKFKVKFRNYPSIFIEGSALNPKANAIAKDLKEGDVVMFFDIENIEPEYFTIDNKNPIETIVVKIK